MRISFRRYLGSMRWFHIPAAAGFALVGYQQYRHIRDRERRKLQTQTPEELVIPSWQVTLLKQLPTRSLSRVAGMLTDITLPIWLRWAAFSAYAWAFKCNMEEAEVEDITCYESFGKFFTRHLKDGARVIDKDHDLVSPADGQILCFGAVCDDKIEQVKGINYSLSTFFGPDSEIVKYCRNSSANGHVNSPTKNGACVDKCLYHCVIYLSPGDYHRFHSPTEWKIQYRRHFPGTLMSVSPLALKFVRGLFAYNERVNLRGEWKHGLFSMTAVGAYNVGSIKINFDSDLATNLPGSFTEGVFKDFHYAKSSVSSVGVGRGENIGEFNFGSTIVLLFEAPTDFNFTVDLGQKIKYGQAIGTSGLQ
ncbi:uncharacterized protein TRIADDRAFT_22345 [Trichoplax adhaerens]|uniref:Phosphatidylserine decarboxylase proenzyme, mitochondrial n=1 Tax=Trichoplax adhaerens TaxID=10228 RepID=B3RR19_TRIAD|nr:hypothetical protein TRIADDRAFT_22345 [Trichoplax adhaerens]EDV26263.1 hypothetical protein TRIADDRAFT_22345 [Trichoplax adhaerens]|eukprot:XP_002110259.1 hypothetical protein TRIADDRAFT_22345 [Trichoplax adhaerens]